MPQIRVIVNPTAGKGHAAKLIPQLKSNLNLHHLDYEICQTEYPWHAARLAEEAILAGTETVVSAGGDGTFNEVLNGIMISKTNGLGSARLGVICIGRGNDFAYSMGIPTGIDEGCLALAQGQTRRIDIGRVTSDLYPEGRYFGNGIGIGFDAMVGFLASEMPYGGMFAYLAGALKAMMIYSPAPVMEVTLDDEVVTQPGLMVSIMNGRRMGGAFMMTPQSQSDDALFDVCIAGAAGRLKILQMIPRFIQGTQAGDPMIKLTRTRKVSVRAIQGSLPAHADGETLCTAGKEIKAEILPQQIDLIYLPKEEKK
ncbi:MAG: diacylglycerol kinase family lipid kinase [Anaerolineae bacterium]|nr:diacylglycerol kinase family lipid kinase [Anaerolineae bacterium]